MKREKTMKKLNHTVFTVSLSLLSILGYAQEKEAYRIYTASGKKANYGKMMKAVQNSDIILFGELHNNSIAHWLQLEMTMDLHESKDLVLGAEMFERDNQDELDRYLSGEIDDKELDSLARLWSNYDTDYRPLVDYAKDNTIPFVGTNIPRRYANLVYKNDFAALDTLTDEEKSWMAPLPIPFDPELPTYKEILEMMGDHGTLTLVKAQAMKDATMAHFILVNYKDGQTFLHFNGAFHSNKYEGILWYLKNERSDLQYSTISTVSQKDVSKLEEENKGLADFIICVDEHMTETYRSRTF